MNVKATEFGLGDQIGLKGLTKVFPGVKPLILELILEQLGNGFLWQGECDSCSPQNT